MYFRDYGRYDYIEMKLARKPKAKLKEHFYIRGDLTRVYFFGLEETNELGVKAGFKVLEVKNLYTEITNRLTEESMNRVWIQAKFIK